MIIVTIRARTFRPAVVFVAVAKEFRQFDIHETAPRPLDLKCGRAALTSLVQFPSLALDALPSRAFSFELGACQLRR